MRLSLALTAAFALPGAIFTATQAFAESYVLHTGPNGYPPFLFVDDEATDIQYSGIIIDLLEAFESENPSFNHSYNPMPRSRANLLIKRGEFTDLMFRSLEYATVSSNQGYLFTDTLIKSDDVVVTRRSDDFRYSRPEDLYGKSVAILRGYIYDGFDELIENGTIAAIPVDLHVQAIGMLEKQRVDAYFGNRIVTPFYLSRMGLDKNDFTFSKTTLSELNLVFMVHPDQIQLHNALNDFIKKVTANGVFDSIVKKYVQ